MLSFHATKVFNTIEGGAICYNDPSLEAKYKSMKNFGLSGEEECEYCGGNAKMNEFQSSMGICNLRHISEYIDGREKAYSQYIKRLANVQGIVLCKLQKDVNSNYAYFPILFDGYKYNRDKIKEILAKNDIAARKYFYPCTNDFACYKKLKSNKTPIAENISKNILCLPMYHDLSIADVNKICDFILK